MVITYLRNILHKTSVLRDDKISLPHVLSVELNIFQLNSRLISTFPVEPRCVSVGAIIKRQTSKVYYHLESLSTQFFDEFKI